MHSEAETDPENNADSTPSISPPDSRPRTQEPLESDAPPESELPNGPTLDPLEPSQDSELQRDTEHVGDEVELEAEGDVDTDVLSNTPEPGASARRKRHRSRSRSRNRNSKDLKRRSPASPSFPEESSQDEGPATIVAPIALPPIISPSFNNDWIRAAVLRSPTPGPPTPTQSYTLPTLDQIARDRGLSRSQSERQRQEQGRNMAFAKLTGGKEELYEASPSPPPPPFGGGGLMRSNTVSGGERSAARANLLDRLNSKRARTPVRELEGRDISLESPFPLPAWQNSPLPASPMLVSPLALSPAPPSPSPSPGPKKKRPRRRSHRSKQSSQSDSEYLSSRSNTPMISDTAIHLGIPLPPDTPNPEQEYMTTNPEDAYLGLSEPSAKPKRPSVLVEDDEDNYPPHNLPRFPRTPPRQWEDRLPHSSDAPSHISTDLGDPDASRVPLYLSHSQVNQGPFPSSPFSTPYKERPPHEEEEEQVLLGPSPQPRELSWVSTSR